MKKRQKRQIHQLTVKIVSQTSSGLRIVFQGLISALIIVRPFLEK